MELDPDQCLFTKRITEKAISFITWNKDHPFFLYLPHIMPHVPIFAAGLKEAAGEAYKTLRRLGNRACHHNDQRIDREEVEACFAALVQFGDRAEVLSKHFNA